MRLCVKCYHPILNESYYPKIKTLDFIERGYLHSIPSNALLQIMEKKILEIKSHTKQRVNRGFDYWILNIMTTSIKNKWMWP